MAESELIIQGMGLSHAVVSSLVSMAAQRVAGVASVGGNDITSNLISVITRRTVDPGDAVACEVVNDELAVTVHLAVFYGYPFKKLAGEVREAVAQAVSDQIGVTCASVNVCIDSLVFPKE